MKHGREHLAVLAGLTALWAAVAGAQDSSKSPAFVASRATFFLCPNLIRTGVAPPLEELEKLGLTEAPPQQPGTMWFESTQKMGALLFTYDPGERRCTTHYVGSGYDQIAHIIRDIALKTSFTRITGGDKDGAKADVLESVVPMDSTKIARVIIIENYKDRSSAISYNERAK